MTTARTFLGVTRALIGIGGWIAPDLTIRLFGMDPDRSDRFVGRLFGSREFALAGALLAAPASAGRTGRRARGQRSTPVDAIAGFDERRRGNLSTQATILGPVGALGFVALGVLVAREASAPAGAAVSDPAAYAHILKRRPAQARSARRIEALLDAAAELLRDREPEAITVRDLAAAAGVPTGHALPVLRRQGRGAPGARRAVPRRDARRARRGAGVPAAATGRTRSAAWSTATRT